MSDITLTWWDSHVVSESGTVISSGWPESYDVWNGTFTMTVDRSAQYSHYVQLTNPNGLWMVFRGDRPSGGIQSGIGELYITPASDAATLDLMRDGFDLSYSEFTGGAQANYESWGGDFTHIRFIWSGVTVDGVPPTAPSTTYDETMSGGSYLNGSIFANKLTTLSVSSAGVLAAGVATNSVTPPPSPHGKLIQIQIAATADDGSWIVGNTFSNTIVEFGSQVPA